MKYVQDDPDVKALHDAYRAKDTEAIKKYSDIVRANVDKKLEALGDDLYTLNKEADTVVEEPSLGKQYRKSIDLYRDVMELVDRIRTLKKSIREDMAKK